MSLQDTLQRLTAESKPAVERIANLLRGIQADAERGQIDASLPAPTAPSQPPAPKRI